MSETAAAGIPVRPRASRDRGQATVEFTMLLPFVAAVLLVAVQVAVLGNARLLVASAAREGVRVAAVGEDTPAIRAAVAGVLGEAPEQVDVAVRRPHGPETVTVEVSHATEPAVPLASAILPQRVVFRSQATMRLEDP